MKSFVRYSLIGAAAAGALVAGPAAAAMKFSEALDGTWYSSSESGRGIVQDYTPRPDGSGTYFGAIFSFDEGDPTWVTIQGDVLEHQHRAEFEVFRTTGGTFGFPYPGASSERIGMATVTLHSCNRMTYDIDIDDDAGLPDVLMDLRPVAGFTNEQCVYTQEFSGCPSFASPAAGLDRACVLNGVYTNEDLMLTNDATWVLDGLVRIGDDNANSGSVTIEPGTVLIGGGGNADYLYISPGSKIFANGLPWAPIVLTSDQDGFISGTEALPGDVGGLVISGNAPSNACPEAPFDCRSEFDQTQRFGGDDPDESSGELSYIQIRYAGFEFQDDAEVNAFTLQGVGRGTKLHHLQAYRGQDDGIEFFGGTANVKYMVVTEGGDDAVDWDLGYSGNLQYGLVVHGEGFGEDHGIEAASNPDDGDLMPRATPVLANYTFVGNGQGGDGIQLKQGSGGQIWNTIVTGFAVSCINLTGEETYSAAGTPGSPSGDTAFVGVIVDCATNFKQDDGAPYSTQDFFNAFPGNAATNPQLDGNYMPQSGSPARTGGQYPGHDYFDHTDYRGAFDGENDWTVGWTHRPFGS